MPIHNSGAREIFSTYYFRLLSTPARTEVHHPVSPLLVEHAVATPPVGSRSSVGAGNCPNPAATAVTEAESGGVPDVEKFRYKAATRKGKEES